MSENRLDKWLWAVRVYKTRTLAAEAAKAGHVLINEQRVKPAREVHIGEVITVEREGFKRQFKVLGVLERRVGAKLVAQFMEEVTPPEEKAKQQRSHDKPFLMRPKGMGRPTKRDRRLLGGLFEPES